MIVVVEYEDENGSHPFEKWFRALNTPAALNTRTALARMENGNFSNVAPVGQGVSEYKLDFGPGYRIYCARVSPVIVLLLGGGTKRRQQNDIEMAKQRMADYKARRHGK